ncbi:MAG TPA: hypothetical protein PKW98_03180 [Candidatus Wallbacteria bacterium]|nr:hypothetical protein [Candidatus Wallbacteria bacterium]
MSKIPSASLVRTLKSMLSLNSSYVHSKAVNNVKAATIEFIGELGRLASFEYITIKSFSLMLLKISL